MDIKIKRLLRNIIEDKKINNQLLTKCGFNKAEIENLLNQNILKQTKKNEYELKNIKLLKIYAKELNQLNDPYNKKYIDYYEKINNFKNIESYNHILDSLKQKDYKKTIEIINKLSKNINRYQSQDMNLYLYLLNKITDLNKEQRNHAKNMNYEEVKIKLNDARYSQRTPYLNIRILIINDKLEYAKKKLIELKNQKKLMISEQIILILLKQAIHEKNKINRQLEIYINNKEYEKLLELLEKLKEKTYISNEQIYTYELLKKIIYIKETNITPVKKTIESNDILNLINNNNFLEAKDLCEKANLTTTSTYKLLLNIIKLIEKTEKENEKTCKENYIKYFGIWNFDSLDNYVKKQKISVEKACLEFDYLDDFIAKIYLIYAQKNLEKKDIYEARRYLNKYQSYLTKTKETEKIYNEIISYEQKLGLELKKIKKP